ncbi:hypothetical protein MSHOH_3125 [Methanosarcina horonobensis HB-1 = JCM 15518]|uniref:Uncharacterized protein n=1 Tax=Methanosarcina horonobensis HB-1 = JCM 15518 TaxID=1434110 RepID=A0A0E3SI66_9EURY|nr:hypothetical protein [Methanosarcina horonobensis]AKB79608.1 hypothetical protein MSHOH_3125 [Methanosarcina horonobensis HB-1 = JCM 15518]
MTDYQKYREEFESFLDEGGNIYIGSNFDEPPSYILFEMDETAYNEQLREYVDQKKEDFPQVVYDSFPAPIAYFYHQTERAYDNEQHRLQLLRSTWEALIYVLYGLVLGEVNVKGFSLNNVRIFDGQKIKQDHRGLMSDKLGWKVEAMEKIIEYDKQNQNELKISSCINTGTFELIKELNQGRNSFSHIAALSEQEAKERYDELSPKVLDLLFELDFLENVSLLRYVNNLGDIHKVRFNKFGGHSLQKQNYDITLSDPDLSLCTSILNNQCILIEFNSVFNVSPFIHFYHEGSQIKLCYFKKIDSAGNYLFELIGGTNREIAINPTHIPNCINVSLGALL